MGVKPLNFFSRGCKFFFQGLPGKIHTAAGMAVVMEEAVLAPFILDPAKNHVI